MLNNEIKKNFKQHIKNDLIYNVNNQEIIINNFYYKLVDNYKNGFNFDEFVKRYSPILFKYDYIVGDWGFDQLRLKGFFSSKKKHTVPDKLISTLEDYLYEYCNFGCSYFVLEKEK